VKTGGKGISQKGDSKFLSKGGKIMHARLLKIQTTPSRIDEAAMLFEESVIPLCKDKTGYKGAYFLGDRISGICLPITLWESEEDMKETEKSKFFQEQVIKFMDLFTAPPLKETFEVIYRDQ